METCKFCTVAFPATHRDVIVIVPGETVSVCPPCQHLVIRAYFMSEVPTERHTAIQTESKEGK